MAAFGVRCLSGETSVAVSNPEKEMIRKDSCFLQDHTHKAQTNVGQDRKSIDQAMTDIEKLVLASWLPGRRVEKQSGRKSVAARQIPQ